MNQETIDYYDKASSGYSDIRYKGITKSFSQYLFKKRRDLFLTLLEGVEKNIPQNATILEIGCADGVLFKAIEEKFPNRFSKLIGMDISPKMIEEATKQNINHKASFFLKDDLPFDKFDVVIELGVHPFDLDTELSYASEHLKTKGYFFYNLVSSKSFFVKIKLKDKYYVKDYKTYYFYEQFLKKYFVTIRTKVYGLFVPKLWSIPFIARFIQPAVDFVFGHIVPELLHEKIYLLQKKD
jgi:SAM-dependent methyltransferase